MSFVSIETIKIVGLVIKLKLTFRKIIIIESSLLFGKYGKTKQISEFRKILNLIKAQMSTIELEKNISNLINSNSLYYEEFTNFEESKVRKKNTINLFYESYWKANKTNKNNWVYGINIVDNLIKNFEFKTVLDAGCGAGDVVRYLLEKGYDAYGAEISETAIKLNAKDLFDKGRIVNTSLANLPFEDNYFDVVFTSEVLEHIPEHQMNSVINELHRVSKRLVFGTISLRPSSNFNKYHCTIKPRNWWENIFNENNFETERDFVNVFQKKGEFSFEEVLLEGPTKTHIHEMEWFVKSEPFSYNGEIEPWYFIFSKK
jgi:SAM-dependent methyltransferase